MADWLVEEGVGEHRALLVGQGTVLAAKVAWPGRAMPGLVCDARLAHRAAGAVRGTVVLPHGEEALVDHLPREASEGATIRVAITRAAIAEQGRLKRAQARPTSEACRPAPSLADSLGARVVRRFESGLWDGVFDLAWTGLCPFAGGLLTITPTPAMTLIDIDGNLAPAALAMAAVPALATALRWLDLGGAIGIDFPGLPDKAARRAVDAALDDALAGWPHESTAMNGFGFVQLVARLSQPSLLHLCALDRPGAAARALLRQVEGLEPGGGPLLLAAHPMVLGALRGDWLEELQRRTGRTVRQQADPALALDGGFAQGLAA
ncbi:MAG: ribonuclease [Proteobacteria bacterium]|nr:ribonuclease [Pseudomonadota bacterium]